MPQHLGGGQRATCKNLVFPTATRVPGIKYRSSYLAASPFTCYAISLAPATHFTHILALPSPSLRHSPQNTHSASRPISNQIWGFYGKKSHSLIRQSGRRDRKHIGVLCETGQVNCLPDCRLKAALVTGTSDTRKKPKTETHSATENNLEGPTLTCLCGGCS